MTKDEIFDKIDEVYSDHDGGAIYLSKERTNQIKEIIQQAINFTPCCTELPIYMTYDNGDYEVFAAFTDRERCEQESKECDVPMQETILYFGKRKQGNYLQRTSVWQVSHAQNFELKQ